jgi:hypothetical protein
MLQSLLLTTVDGFSPTVERSRRHGNSVRGLEAVALGVSAWTDERAAVGSGQLAEFATAVADELSEQGWGQVARGVVDEVAQSAEVLLVKIEVPGHDE